MPDMTASLTSSDKSTWQQLCSRPDLPALTVWASVLIAVGTTIGAANSAVPETINASSSSGTTTIIALQWHLASVAAVLLFASQQRAPLPARSNRLLPALTAATHEVIVLACSRMVLATVTHMFCYGLFSVSTGTSGVVPYVVRNVVAGVAATCGVDVLVRTTLVPLAGSSASQAFPLALQCAVVFIFSVAPTLALAVDFRAGLFGEVLSLSIIMPFFFYMLWVIGGCPRAAPLPPVACTSGRLYHAGATSALAGMMNSKHLEVVRATFTSIIMPMTGLSALTAVGHLAAGVGHGVCLWNSLQAGQLEGMAPISDPSVQSASVTCSRLGDSSVDWHYNLSLIHENNQAVRMLVCVLAWMWVAHALQSAVLGEQSEVSTAMLRWLSHECRSPVTIALLSVDNILTEDLVGLERGLTDVTAACTEGDQAKVKTLITGAAVGVRETKGSMRQLEAPLHMLVGVLDNMLQFLKHRSKPSATLASLTRQLDVGGALIQASRMITDIGPTLGGAAPHISFAFSASRAFLGAHRSGPHSFGMAAPLPRLHLLCTSTANTFTLQQVLLNLLSNAVKYGVQDGREASAVSVQVGIVAAGDADAEASWRLPRHTRGASSMHRISISGLEGPVPGAVVVPMQSLGSAVGVAGGSAVLATAPAGEDKSGARLGEVDGEQEAVLRVSVSDSGRGMTGDEMESLFTPFARLRAGRLQQGTGLGLWLMRELLRSQGGDLTVSSAGLGCGCTFTATMPVRVTKDTVCRAVGCLGSSASIGSTGSAAKVGGWSSKVASAVPGAAADPKGAAQRAVTPGSAAAAPSAPMPRILLVDDSRPLRDQLARRLRRMGCLVVAQPEGASALAAWRADPAAFDAVVCDMSMPVMDGPSLARALRSEAGFQAPFLGLTGQALEEDMALFREAGADTVLTKPATAAMVLEQVQALLHASEEEALRPEMRETKSL